MKKKLTVTLLTLLMMVGALAGCASKSNESKAPQKFDSKVNLMDMYTVTDPEGVDYDARYAMYMPILENSEDYNSGARYMFTVIYGKENKGQYMCTVEIFETEDQALAYQAEAGCGTVDGKAYINENDATFFATMESFVPTVADWVSNQKQNGMMDIEQ